MSINNFNIRATMRAIFEAVAGIPGVGYRAYENLAFKPAEGNAWIRETLMPADQSLSANKELWAKGIYQLDYFVPIGSGTKIYEDVADAIIAAFAPATTLNNLVKIVKSYRKQGRPDPNGAWYHIPILIHYDVFTTIN